jgi:small-conductance mechanosensitive channel
MPIETTDLRGLLLLIGLQAAILAVFGLALHVLIGIVAAWIGRIPSSSLADFLALWRKRLRRTTWLSVIAALLTCAAIDVAALRLHGDPWAFWWGLAGKVSPETWHAIAWAAGRIVAAAVIALILIRIVRGILGALGRRIVAWGRLRAEPAELDAWLACVGRGARDAAWLGVAVYAAAQARLPEVAVSVLVDLVLIYLAVAVGRCLGRALAACVATADALGAEWTQRRGWQEWYARVRPLAPLLHRCLDYVLWIAVATFALGRLGPMAGLAEWGPRLIEAIGIFFLARVALALAALLIERRLLAPAPADATPAQQAILQRRATFAPLANSAAQVAIWVTAGVFALGVLGFDTTPILAGIGALGLVVGLGARGLIEDITMGFCIVYEGMFLVGDFIEVDGARGTVESIGFRTTSFRDLDGRVHILRNGELRKVVSYSRDFTNAVVRVEVGYDADLPAAMAALAEAGRRTRAEHGPMVLADADLSAIESYNPSSMTLRAILRCAPAKHWAVAAAYRVHLRECLADRGVRIAVPRQEVAVMQAAPA